MKHVGPISGIAVHGNYVATAGYDNQVILWSADTGEALSRGLHDHLVNHCAFSNDGRWLVSAGSDCSARVWELPAMRLKMVLPDHGDDVDMAVFSPGDSLIATCALDRSVRVFDRAGRCLKLFNGHTGNVLSLAWSRDGKYLISSSVDGTIREWDVFGEAAARVNDLGIRTDTLAMDRNGIIYAGDDHGRIARIENGRINYVLAHRAGVKKLTLDEGRNTLVTLSYDRTLAIWQLDADGNPQEVSRTVCPNSVWARSAATLPDGRIAVGTFGGSYAIYDSSNAQWDMSGAEAGDAIDAILATNRHVYTVGDAGRVREDGRVIAEMGSLCNFLVNVGERLVTGGQLGELYDASTGEVFYTHHSPLNCGVDFVRNGEVEFVIGTYTGELLHFGLDQQGAPQLIGVISVFENAVKAVATDNETLFTVCANTSFAQFEIAEMRQIEFRAKAHDRIANACCALGDNNFASIGRDRILRLWLASGEESYPSPHHNSVKCMAISDDRRTIMTGSYRGMTAAFDLVTRSWRPVKQPTSAGIAAMAWDDKRACFLAASYDGNVYPVAA